MSDVSAIDQMGLEATFIAANLIDLLRARTFPGHSGAFFLTPDGQRVDLRLTLKPNSTDEGRS